MPILLIHNGEIVTPNLSKEKVTREELEQALREHGVAGIGEFSRAVLEIDGSIGVLRTGEMPAAARPHHRVRFLPKNHRNRGWPANPAPVSGNETTR